MPQQSFIQPNKISALNFVLDYAKESESIQRTNVLGKLSSNVT